MRWTKVKSTWFFGFPGRRHDAVSELVRANRPEAGLALGLEGYLVVVRHAVGVA